jgi:hypothetical protein
MGRESNRKAALGRSAGVFIVAGETLEKTRERPLGVPMSMGCPEAKKTSGVRAYLAPTPPCGIAPKNQTPACQAATLTFSVATEAIVFRICEAI